MIKKRVCIAHYNEDLSWIEKINDNVEIFVYHKKDNDLNYNEKIVLADNNFELRNVGRESHTYIKHIVDNYDNLSDIEYFSQGYPAECDFVHVINNDSTIEYKHYSNHNKVYYSQNGYLPSHMVLDMDKINNSPMSWKNENKVEILENVYYLNGRKFEDYDTRFIWDYLFPYEPPQTIEVIPHAFFKLNKSRILMHKKEVYLKCLSFFEDNKKNNRYAWTFEYFWPLLFNECHLKTN